MNFLIKSINYLIIVILILFFINHKKTTRSRLYLFSVLVVFFIINLLLTNIFISLPIFGINYNISTPIVITLLLLSLIPISKNKLQILSSSIIPIIIDFTLKIIMSFFLNISFLDINSTGYYYFTLLFFIIELFIYFSIFLIYKLLSSISYNENKPTIIISSIIILLEMICFFSINYNLSQSIIRYNESYSGIILFNILFLVLFIISTICAYILQKSIQKRYQEILEYKEKLLSKAYDEIFIEEQEELFKLRHDIANIVATIKDDNDDALEIKKSLTNRLENKIHYTDNIIINKILVIKAKFARENNIDINISCGNTTNINIKPQDIISLLSNIIDNAIEGSIKSSDKKIEIQLGVENNNLEVMIANSFDTYSPKTKKENPKYHGFGIKIIKEIVKKYNGIYETNILNNMFYTTITLTI